MRRSIFYCLMLLLSAEAAYAQARGGHINTPAWGGSRVLTSTPAADPPSQDTSKDRPNRPPPVDGVNHDGVNHDSGQRDHAQRDHERHDHHGHNHGWQRPRPPYWNHGFGWSWYLPPVFVSPVFNEFGYTFTLPNVNPVPAARPLDWLAPAANPPAPAPAPADALPPGRISSPELKARAGRYVSYGDNLFTKQKYLAALGRYKSASDAASDMAEAYLRQGFAYVAMGQYENASKAFRRGLALRSNWQGTAFRLSTLYDGAEAAKTQHIEKLALAVEDNPFDSGLLMTLGIELFFDGQFDRAELCFQNAARLGGGDEALVADFLSGAKAGGAPAAKPRKVSF